MRIPATLLALATLLPAVAGAAPYFRMDGKNPTSGASAPQSSGNGAPSGTTAFLAAPSSATYQPGGPVNASAPATSGTTSSTTYALLRDGSDIGASLPTLCPGLQFDPATGTITGTPSRYCSLTNLAYQANTPGQPSALSAPFDILVRSTYAVASQPASMTTQVGTAKSTTATIQGSPYGSVAWSLLGPAGTTAGVPTWIALDSAGCAASSLSCQVNASPGTTVTPGVYPATGTFTLAARDSSGTTVSSQGFTATVQPVATAANACAVAYTSESMSTADLGVYGKRGSVILFEYLSGATAQRVDVTFPTPVEVDRMDIDIRSTKGGALQVNVIPFPDRTATGAAALAGNWGTFNFGTFANAADPATQSVTITPVTARVFRIQWGGSANSGGQQILEYVKFYRNGVTANCP